MNRRFLVISSVIAGICLLGLGLAWNRLVPSSAYWSPEQAKEYSDAQIEAHAKSHEHGHHAEKEMAVARERFSKISQQLEDARGSRRRTGTMFLAAGVLLVVAGLVLHLSESRSD
jgi:Flp pilus assembly protein TadB